MIHTIWRGHDVTISQNVIERTFVARCTIQAYVISKLALKNSYGVEVMLLTLKHWMRYASYLERSWKIKYLVSMKVVEAAVPLTDKVLKF